MSIKIYNDLTRKKEEFQPLNPSEVKMYVCGITPYDETHLGHGRAYVTFDVVRRYLEVCGFKVAYVQNITDVDDKIIQKSKINPKTEIPNPKQECEAIAERYTQAYFEIMDRLNVKRATHYPKATENIEGMVKWIKGLEDKGYAYQLEDGVYFEVDKFKGYGKLSGRQKAEAEAGVRVEVNLKKRNPLDFALWKKAKDGEPSWPSPWGAGRPAWHIECSVMSTKYLGEQFDIHGGGLDLEFPHHENEIAQTEALTGKVPWVKYWIHNGFVNINKQKMSKSLGNFFTLKDIFTKYDPMVVRFFLLATHYRSPINYSDQELTASKEAYGRIISFIQNIDFLLTHPPSPSLRKRGGGKTCDCGGELKKFKDQFLAAMDDDFNTAAAIAMIFETIKFCNKTLGLGENEQECLKAMRKAIIELCEILGLKIESRTQTADSPSTSLGASRTQEIDKLVAEREAARKAKNFKRADEIRKILADQGITIEDTAHGAKWKTRT